MADNSSGGFTLVELAVSIGLLGVLMLAGLKVIVRTDQLRVFTQDIQVLTELEESLRHALQSNVALTASAVKSNDLRACLASDGRNCPSGRRKFSLYNVDRSLLSGSYESDGRRCNTDCVIDVEVEFEGICPVAGRCDRAKYMLFSYKIFADYALIGRGIGARTIVRSGLIRRSFEIIDPSDENFPCELDRFARTRFARKIRPTGVDCVSSPRLARDIDGIEAKDCKPGVELLAGFDANGKGICQDIKFEKRKSRPRP